MVSRPPVTLVVVASEPGEATRTWLDALRPTIGPKDQVIVVLPRHRPAGATGRWLGRYPWVEVLDVRAPGLVAGWNEGARQARNPLVVLVHADTTVLPRWIEHLVSPFSRAGVVAAGPRTNHGQPHQQIGSLPYAPGDREALRRFARERAHVHQGEHTAVTSLGEPALALRRDALGRAGWLDQDLGDDLAVALEDLCARLMAAGGEVVLAEGCYVHHAATCSASYAERETAYRVAAERFAARHGRPPVSRPEPLVSACLIARDEEDDLPACLDSLVGFADEVILYDTGSSDATRELAASRGATVLEGFWDDDFSRARNAALERCSGTWIAWLDADETLVTEDREGLRGMLEACPEALEGFLVSIDNLTGAGTSSSFVHVACRLFRRRSGMWRGRLHEQVAAVEGRSVLLLAPLDGARIRHTGYLDKRMAARAKLERNLRVAKAEVEEIESASVAIPGYSLVSLGRSLGSLPGRHEEALEHLRRGAEETTDPTTRRLAERSAAEMLIALGRLDEALEWIARLREDSITSVLPDSLEARICIRRGEHAKALGLLAPITGSVRDDDLFEYGPHSFAAMRAEALVGLGRHSEAADVLLASLTERGTLDIHLGQLVACLKQANRELGEVAAALPADRLTPFLAQVLQFLPGPADELLEACWDKLPDRNAVLATAASFARRLPLDRTLVWSARLRADGLGALCPLRATAEDPNEAPRRRVHAAAVAVQMFADEAALEAIGPAFASLPPIEIPGSLHECAQLAPALGGKLQAIAMGGHGGIGDEIPKVSVILPLTGDANAALASLTSLATSLDEALSFEVIVVLDAASPATENVLSGVAGDVRILRNPEPVGFHRSLAVGATHATGEVLALLDQGALPRPGWLEALLGDLMDDPGIAAAGPLLVAADGTCWSAGGIMDDQGPRHHGRGCPPALPNLLRRWSPDWLASSCLVIRRGAFEAEIGAFLGSPPRQDELSDDQPDAERTARDAAFGEALRARGWRLAVDPDAVVQLARDVRATSPGRVATSATPASGAGLEASRTTAPGTPLCGDLTGLPVRRPHKEPSLLVLDRHPGSIRTRQLIEVIRPQVEDVGLYAFGAATPAFARRLGRLGLTCWGWDDLSAPRDPELRRAWGEVVRPELNDLIDQMGYSAVLLAAGTYMGDKDLLGNLRAAHPELRLIIDLEATPPADLPTPSSAAYAPWTSDAALGLLTSRRALSGDSVMLLPSAPACAGPPLPRVARAGLLCVGSAGRAVVEAGIRWWREDVAPSMTERSPGARLRLLGPGTLDLRHALGDDESVTALGLPPDTVPYIRTALALVAPFPEAVYEAEILSALCAGTPVVTTRALADELGLGSDNGVLASTEGDSMADDVVALLTDPSRWEDLSAAAVLGATGRFRAAGEKTSSSIATLQRWTAERLKASG